MKNVFIALSLCFTLNIVQASDVGYSAEDNLALIQNINNGSENIDLHAKHKEQLELEIELNEAAEQDLIYGYGLGDALIDSALLGGVLASRSILADDKYKHLLVGTLIGYSGYSIGRIIFKNSKHKNLYSRLSAFGLATLAGALKEAYDSGTDGNGNRRGNAEFNDFLVTSLGGAAVALRFTIKFNFKRKH